MRRRTAATSSPASRALDTLSRERALWNTRNVTDPASQPFTLGENTLVWDSFGDRSAGPVFVLLHGLGMGRSVFNDLAPRLAVGGWVIRIDLPGFGDAPEPRRVGSVHDTALLVLGLLDEQGVTGAVLVGHSLGSQICVEIALERADAASALVLIGPVIDPEARSSSLLFRRMVRDLYDDSPKVLLKGLWLYFRAGVPLYFRKLRMMLAYRMERQLPQVGVPVLIVRGASDIVAPLAWCTAAAALPPDGRLVEIPGRGHETFINDPEPTVLAIEAFLGESGILANTDD